MCMKYLSTLILLMMVSTMGLSQSNVDQLVQGLDSISLGCIDHWKVSPNLSSYTPAGDPTQAGFDDSGWQTLKVNQRIYLDSCWLR
jgi:hypothetical protein